MRINDTNSTTKTNSTKKKSSTSGSSGAGLFSLGTNSDVGSNEPSGETQNIANLQSLISMDALNMLSQANDEGYSKKQNIDWGKDILKQLETLKYQILNGKISHSSLLDLQNRITNIPINPQDHKLRQIIEDIEIRAAVEIEKLKKLTNSSEI